MGVLARRIPPGTEETEGVRAILTTANVAHEYTQQCNQ